MEKSLRFVNKKVRDNETEIQKLKIENDQRALEYRQESAERRSREWGIRVHGVPINKINGQEDTHAVLTRIVAVHKLAGLDTEELASAAIEHCHRLPVNEDRPTDKPPVIIANLYSRPLRNKLLKDAREINNSRSAIYFPEDMTKADHQAKWQAKPQMRKVFQEGKRVIFGEAN